MSAKFDEMAAECDALYQATLPRGEFAEALKAEEIIASCLRLGWISAASEAQTWRDTNLLKLAIRTLRNQGGRGLTAHQEVKPG